jgi:hypothetical protein
MAKEPVPFRLDPELIALLDEQAAAAGRRRGPHISAIIESHLRGNGQAAPSDEFLNRHDQILRELRSILEECGSITQIVGRKECEASTDFTAVRKQLDQLRSDIATLFGAALETFAGVERSDAIAFTQRYMYPGGRGHA